MKKLLGTTLALAMLVPAGANAELLKNFKVSGNLDIQTTSARNVRDFVTRGAGNNDRLGHATTRVMLKMDWDLLDDVHARVTLVKGAGAAGARTYGSDAQTLDNITAQTIVQEANVKIDKVFGHVDMTAGRQFYGAAGDLVIYYGPYNTYGLGVTAIDMFRADWNGEHMSVTAIAGKTTDGPVTTVENTTLIVAQDLRGMVVSHNTHEMVKPSLYVYNRVTRNIGGLNTNLWVAGLKAKIATGGLTASADLAQNFGEDRNPKSKYKGWAFLGKAAYKLDLSNVGMITPWGELGYGSGDSNATDASNRDFQTIATGYRPGGIYGRFNNNTAIVLGSGVALFNGASNGLTNRIIWGFGVKATPAAVEKLTLGTAFYRYAFAKNTAQSRNIGSEVNVTGDWKHSENVSFKATAGSFLPGKYVADVNGPAGLNPVAMLAVDVAIKF